MLLILGQGYCGDVLASAARAQGLAVTGVRRTAAAPVLGFDDPAVGRAIAQATHILSSAPPDSVSGNDPMLARYGTALQDSGAWLGYLSSTGVYGDTGGAFVDEASPVGTGRRAARTVADLAWQAIGATVFRLPGIYGPGRSALDQVRAGTARRIDRPGHRFNRIHVDDIAGAVLAAMRAQATGIFNVVDCCPAEPRAVTEAACAMLGVPLPPLAALDEAALSAMARGFWSEQRAISGGRLARVLGYRLRYPDYKAGLRAIRDLEAGA